MEALAPYLEEEVAGGASFLRSYLRLDSSHPFYHRHLHPPEEEEVAACLNDPSSAAETAEAAAAFFETLLKEVAVGGLTRNLRVHACLLLLLLVLHRRYHHHEGVQSVAAAEAVAGE